MSEDCEIHAVYGYMCSCDWGPGKESIEVSVYRSPKDVGRGPLLMIHLSRIKTAPRRIDDQVGAHRDAIRDKIRDHIYDACRTLGLKPSLSLYRPLAWRKET